MTSPKSPGAGAANTPPLTTLVLGSLRSALTNPQSRHLGVPRQTPFPVSRKGTPKPRQWQPQPPATVIQAPLARSGLTAPGHSLAHLPSRAGGRPDDPETDTAAWGRGTRKGACSEGPTGPVAHLGVAEFHHHVLAAPSRRHRQRPTAGATGLRAPTPCTGVPGLSKPHSALRSATPRPARLVARHWFTHHWVRPLFSVPPIPAPCRPRDRHAPFFRHSARATLASRGCEDTPPCRKFCREL